MFHVAHCEHETRERSADIDDAVYAAEEREAISQAFFWKTLARVHYALSECIAESYYSAAYFMFAEHVSQLASSQIVFPIKREAVDQAARPDSRRCDKYVSPMKKRPASNVTVTPQGARKAMPSTSRHEASPLHKHPSVLAAPPCRSIASSCDSDIVTLPIGNRSVTPLRRANAVPAPAPSVKALLDERRKCEERRIFLRKQSSNDDSVENVRPSSARRLSVLHAGPLEHHRTISAQRSRSPLNSRVSPVPVKTDHAANENAISSRSPLRRETRQVTSSPATVRHPSPLQRKSPLKRSEPAVECVAVATVRPEVRGEVPSVSTLVDPRKVGISSVALPKEPRVGSRSGSVQSSGSIRRVSPNPVRSSQSGALSTNSGKPTPRVTSAPASARLPPVDYISQILKCKLNRSLEVDSIDNCGATPLQLKDLLLEVDGKSMSTIDQLQSYFESIASRPNPSDTSVSLLRGTEFLVVNVSVI